MVSRSLFCANHFKKYATSEHHTTVYVEHSHTGSYDFLIVRLVAIWGTCDRSAMFATISRSLLRSVFVAGGRSWYDWSYAWSRDQQRLEKINGKIRHIVGNRTTSGSHKRSIVRSIVAPDDRSYDQSWNSATDSAGRRMGSDLTHRNISTFYNVSEQSICGTTGRNVTRPVARLIVRLLMKDMESQVTSFEHDHRPCCYWFAPCDHPRPLRTVVRPL